MTFTISPWVAWGVAALALFGVVTILYLVSGVLERLGDWWQDRREPLADEDEGFRDGVGDGDTEGLPPLPPVRSAVELGFTGPQPATTDLFLETTEDGRWKYTSNEHLAMLVARRERWAPAWEAEARSAYQALDLDYPSGLLARIREQT